MFCSRCGNELQIEAKFCPKCGQPTGTSNQNSAPDEWFYINNSMRCGPCDKEKISVFIQQGQISKDTLVWKKGMLNWLPAGQTELIHTIKDVVPPMPNNIVSNKYAWTLATIPILISWFVELIGFPTVVVIICTISLNVIFLMLDSDELNKVGINVNNWMWMGIVLVPAYLFVRASKTNKQYGYKIVVFKFQFFEQIISQNYEFFTRTQKTPSTTFLAAEGVFVTGIHGWRRCRI